MSQNINYSIEKFTKAVLILAASPESIQVRLANAVPHLEILREGHVPDSLQAKFTDLISDLSGKPDRAYDGAWSADLSDLPDSKAVELAEGIVNFTLSLQHWMAWDRPRS